MKRTIILSTALLALTLHASAQKTNKLSVEAQMLLEQRAEAAATNRSMQTMSLPFIIRIDERQAAETIEALKAAGATLHGRLGQQLSADVPVESLDAIAALEGVLRIGTAGLTPKPMTDISRKETLVSAIDGSESTMTPTYTGKGVTCAIIDTGFDFQHPAFKDSEGNTRIKAYYSPYDNGGNPVVIDGMQLPGSVYDTPELIAKLTTDLEFMDHGSHTASTMAGTRSPQGWGGMAPDADIVLCSYLNKNDMPDPMAPMVVDQPIQNPTVFDALVFLKHYAEQSGKPMAVNMSIGNIAGPHNGKNEMPKAISDFIQPGRLVFISSGNSGNETTHLQKVFKSDKDTLRTMIQAFSNIQLDGYTKQTAPLNVQIRILRGDYNSGDATLDYARRQASIDELVDDNTNPKVERWDTVWTSAIVKNGEQLKADNQTGSIAEMPTDAFEQLYVRIADDPTLGQTRLIINIDNPPSIPCAIELSVWSSEGTQLDIFNCELKSLDRSNCTAGTTELSTNDWCVSEKAVSVGNYCANTTQRNIYNNRDEELPKLGDISPSSSYGTALNNRQIPMVSAPGEYIVAAINHYIEEMKPFVVQDMMWLGYPYNECSGTSMSSPTMAGIAALWLQANPTLSPEDIETILKESCRTDEFTKAKPERFGYGKVDAKKGLELAIQSAQGIQTVRQTQPADAVYDLQGRRLNAVPAKGMYIRNGKLFVAK